MDMVMSIQPGLLIFSVWVDPGIDYQMVVPGVTNTTSGSGVWYE